MAQAELPDDPDRPYHVLDDPLVYPVILGGVLLTTALPVLLGQQVCLPVLNGLVLFPFFAWALRAGRPRRAIGLALFWALCQTLALFAATLIAPDLAANAVRQGVEGRSEAVAWIATGTGDMASPARFLPAALRDLALFGLAALLTGGLGALALLAGSLNAHSFFVASLLREAASPALLLLAGWPLWQIVRLAGAITAAAALAEPVAVLDLRPQWWAAWWPKRRRLLGVGLAILVLSLLLQVLLTPIWDDLLRAATGF